MNHFARIGRRLLSSKQRSCLSQIASGERVNGSGLTGNSLEGWRRTISALASRGFITLGAESVAITDSGRRRLIPWGHGGRYTPEYRAWSSMIGRCESETHRAFPNYGGRGIRVCSSWRESFPVFAVDMGPRPSPHHSLDRVNNDGNYSCGKCEECIANRWPSNCRWATRSQQQRNRRGCAMLTLSGIARNLVEWAEIHGMTTTTLRRRLATGLTLREALDRALPLDGKRARAKLRPSQVTEARAMLASGAQQKAVAERFGVSRGTISLLARGLTWKESA